MPQQSAAAAAYDADAQRLNAEAERINAETQRLQAEFEQLNAEFAAATKRVTDCVDGMSKLEVRGSPDLIPLEPTHVEAIETAIVQARAWRPPASRPPSGKWGAPPRGSPARPLYDILRDLTPHLQANVTLRAQPKPAINSPDPASPGRRFVSAAHRDHIISLAEIMHMRGFLQLTPQNMYQVINARVNLQWLSRWANLTKSSRSASEISVFDARWRRSQGRLESNVRKQLQDAIDQLLRSQG